MINVVRFKGFFEGFIERCYQSSNEAPGHASARSCRHKVSLVVTVFLRNPAYEVQPANITEASCTSYTYIHLLHVFNVVHFLMGGGEVTTKYHSWITS